MSAAETLLDHLHEAHQFQWKSGEHNGFVTNDGTEIACDAWLAEATPSELEEVHQHDHAEYEGGGGLFRHVHEMAPA